MSNEKSVPRILQQDAPNDSQMKPAAKPQQEIGEGSYEATRDYQKDIGEYLKDADVEADAKAARPKSEQEAREMKQAEEEGLSHSKGEK